MLEVISEMGYMMNIAGCETELTLMLNNRLIQAVCSHLHHLQPV